MAVSLESWQHLECAEPHRCYCECPTCRRAWLIAGCPQFTVPYSRSIHVELSTADERKTPPEARASA